MTWSFLLTTLIVVASPGTGVLYVREAADLAPWRIGGTGYRSDLVMQPVERPMRFEAGTPNVPGIVGFGKAVELAGAELAEEAARLTSLRTFSSGNSWGCW